MPGSNDQRHVAPAGELFATMVAKAFVEYANAVFTIRDRFSLALTGGNSPRPVYSLLSRPPWKDRIDWTRVDFFWGDERTVPPDHEDSNYRMARETLLQPLAIPARQIHRMPADARDLDAAARLYEQRVVDAVKPAVSAVPSFDLILLGMGDDGHTASLFPDTEALREEVRLVVANEVPQLHTRRMTITYPLINAARAVWFMVTGAGKAPRIAEIFAPNAPVVYPCQRIALADEPVHWYLDSAAASVAPKA